MSKIPTVAIYGRTPAKQKRLLFCAMCLDAVMPDSDEERVTKTVLFDRAARYGRVQADCPFPNVNAMRVYLRNHWPQIRTDVLPSENDCLPCYINGNTWGGGGGFRKGDEALAKKQVVRDGKIVEGVLKANNKFADATVQVFPRVAAKKQTLVTRSIGR